MAKNDLTLGEVEYAERYRLNPNQFDELKNYFEQINRKKVYDEIRKQVVQENEQLQKSVEKEIRPKIRDELQAEIRKDLESKFVEEQRLKIRTQVEGEIAGAAPTPKQREAARDMAREIEVDALASARAASDLADEGDASFSLQRKFRSAAFYSLFFSLLPVLAYLYIVRGWGFGIPFIAVAVPYLISVFVSGFANDAFYTRAKNQIAKYRSKSTDFRAVAAKAKETWMVRINTANTKGDLLALIQGLPTNGFTTDRGDDRDAVFIPAAALVKARVQVKDELTTDIDVEKFLRVENQDEDEPAVDRVSLTKAG